MLSHPAKPNQVMIPTPRVPRQQCPNAPTGSRQPECFRVRPQGSKRVLALRRGRGPTPPLLIEWVGKTHRKKEGVATGVKIGAWGSKLLFGGLGCPPTPLLSRGSGSHTWQGGPDRPRVPGTPKELDFFFPAL